MTARICRCVILGPVCLFLLAIALPLHALFGEPNVRHYPRWTWQLIWYGYAAAVEMP